MIHEGVKNAPKWEKRQGFFEGKGRIYTVQEEKGLGAWLGIPALPNIFRAQERNLTSFHRRAVEGEAE
ncbi:MAG: hypothetical protein D6732_02135 [Methanobacteriota archaeon]|nr:MAG: hypothetical protein D6732_02135 [Euryarchaeota archaeon]